MSAPREPEIREALSNWLRPQLESNSAILNEYTIMRGQNRVDVAVVGQKKGSELWGFEIKSDVDTLKRLPDQAKYFSWVFSRMTLVVGPTHLLAASKLIPDWWGILVVTRNTEGVCTLQKVRDPVLNPKLNYRWVARLLWREEILTALKNLGRGRGTSKMSRAKASEYLRSSVPEHKLIPIITEAILARKDWLQERGA